MKHWATVTHPVLLLDTTIAKKNLARMAKKVERSGSTFRPHFKTHQSATIGTWFRDFGVDSIAVSSVPMAIYFATRGWRDILISFPFFPAQWPLLRSLAAHIKVGVIVSNTDSAAALQAVADAPVDVWIEVDAGQERTGFSIADEDTLIATGRALQAYKHLTMTGLHLHAGQSYGCRGTAALEQLATALLPQLDQLRENVLTPNSWQLSFGDTPLCSYLDDLSFADELRPGNFLLYDLMQYQIGSCRAEDIAVAVACPVVDPHFIYGGAVHFSKDRITVNGQSIYGTVALPAADGWQVPKQVMQQPLVKLSQEHGWLSPDAPPLPYGTAVPVLPVHSCLTVEALPYYQTTEGQRIEKFSTKMLP